MAITLIDRNYFEGGGHITDTISNRDLAEIINELINKANSIPDKIQSGIAAVAGATFVDVTFPVAFAAAPKVNATAEGNYNVWVTNRAAASCRINFSAAYTGNVNWIATA